MAMKCVIALFTGAQLALHVGFAGNYMCESDLSSIKPLLNSGSWG